MKKRQAAFVDLHCDILKEILIRVAISPDGAKDFANAMLVCKAFRRFVEDEDVLRAVVFDNLSMDGRWESFQLMRGLVCRCAQAGKEQAQFTLAKIILVSTSQLLTAKKEAIDQEASSSSTGQAEDINLPKEGTQASDFVENFLLAQTCLKFIGYHYDFVKIFLTRAGLSEFSDMKPYIQDYMDYFIGCRQLGDEHHMLILQFVGEQLDLCQYFWCREVGLRTTAVDFFAKASVVHLVACKGLRLLGLEKQQEEIWANHHRPLRIGYPAIMVEELDRELQCLRALKSIIDQINKAPAHNAAVSALPDVEEVTAILNEMEWIKAEASRFQEYREQLISDLDSVLHESPLT